MTNQRSKSGPKPDNHPYQRGLGQRVGVSVYGDDALRIAYGQYCKEQGLDRSQFVWDALNQASGGRIFKMADALRKAGMTGRAARREKDEGVRDGV